MNEFYNIHDDLLLQAGGSGILFISLARSMIQALISWICVIRSNKHLIRDKLTGFLFTKNIKRRMRSPQDNKSGKKSGSSATNSSKNTNDSNTTMVGELIDIYKSVKQEYVESIESNPRLALIDGLIVLSITCAVSQVIYLMLVGSFPFNSFLSGLLSCMGTYAFAVSLRLRITSPEFKGTVSERQAFAEFVMCCLVMYFMVACFMG